jgi:hypothetical protein
MLPRSRVVVGVRVCMVISFQVLLIIVCVISYPFVVLLFIIDLRDHIEETRDCESCNHVG